MRTRRRASSRCDRADESVSPCGSNFEMVKPLTLRTRKQKLPTNALVESEAFWPQSVPLQGTLSVIGEVGGSTPLLWVCFQTTLSKQAKKHGLPDWPGLSLGSFRSWGLGPLRSGCPVLIVLGWVASVHGAVWQWRTPRAPEMEAPPKGAVVRTFHDRTGAFSPRRHS